MKLNKVTAAQPPQHLQICQKIPNSLTRTIAIDDLQQRGRRQAPDALPCAGRDDSCAAGTLRQQQAGAGAAPLACLPSVMLTAKLLLPRSGPSETM